MKFQASPSSTSVLLLLRYEGLGSADLRYCTVRGELEISASTHIRKWWWWWWWLYTDSCTSDDCSDVLHGLAVAHGGFGAGVGVCAPVAGEKSGLVLSSAT